MTLTFMQVSLIYILNLPDHSVSNHTITPCRHFNTLPLSATGFRLNHGSRLRQWIAGSSGVWRRIEFVTLRTGRSPSVASHPASRRRSYSRLQTGERMSDGDLHPADYVCAQAHDSRSSWEWGL